MNTKEKNGIERKYVSDEIGSEYLEWKKRDIILITAPTGTGKSHFILYTFLKRVIENNEKLIYFVNRRILRDQLIDELKRYVEMEMLTEYKKVINLDNYIRIQTYQRLEEDLRGNEPERALSELQKYHYVVYDECHYFLADSNFNTNTELSYDCLRREFDYKVQIFMSATMRNIQECILKRGPIYLPGFEELKTVHPGDRYRIKEYGVPQVYDYIRLDRFEDMKDLAKIIGNGEEKAKWLIFVDSIPMGEELKSILTEKSSNKNKNKISETDIVFVTAEYKKEEDTRNTVKEIVETYKSKEKIVISTEVMYNGVSFHDENLVNMAIFADTEENFIQMLGRKRKDNRHLKLYICKRNTDHFKRHLQQARQTLRFYDSIQNSIGGMYNFVGNEKKVELSAYIILYHTVLPRKGYKMNYSPFFQTPYLNLDYNNILAKQQPILDKISTDELSEKSSQKICYYVNGLIAVNEFSIQKCIKDILFYNGIIQELEDDENAFLRMQGHWLGKSDDEIDDFLQITNMNIFDRYCQEFKEEIKDYLNVDISDDKNKEMKLKLKKYFIYFLRNSEEYKSDMKTYDNQIRYLGQKDRVISIKWFNLCMEYARLPYKMSKPYDGRGRKGGDNENQNIFKIIDTSVSQDTPEDEPEN